MSIQMAFLRMQSILFLVNRDESNKLLHADKLLAALLIYR